MLLRSCRFIGFQKVFSERLRSLFKGMRPELGRIPFYKTRSGNTENRPLCSIVLSTQKDRPRVSACVRRVSGVNLLRCKSENRPMIAAVP